jgi:hypothetical protein
MGFYYKFSHPNLSEAKMTQQDNINDKSNQTQLRILGVVTIILSVVLRFASPGMANIFYVPALLTVTIIHVIVHFRATQWSTQEKSAYTYLILTSDILFFLGFAFQSYALQPEPTGQGIISFTGARRIPIIFWRDFTYDYYHSTSSNSMLDLANSTSSFSYLLLLLSWVLLFALRKPLLKTTKMTNTESQTHPEVSDGFEQSFSSDQPADTRDTVSRRVDQEQQKIIDKDPSEIRLLAVGISTIILSAVLRLLAPGWGLLLFGIPLLGILLFHAIIQYKAIQWSRLTEPIYRYLILASNLFFFIGFACQADYDDFSGSKVPILFWKTFYEDSKWPELFGYLSNISFLILFLSWILLLALRKTLIQKQKLP